jgi:VWFA-related protein
MVRSAKFACYRLLLLLTVLPASSLDGRAQNRGVSRGPSAEPQTIEPPLAKNQIRVHANEVIAPVTVTDKKGELVLDLAQTDFHVFENGVEQAIDYWDLDGDSLAVALVIETSSHIQAMMPVIHSLGSIFTETVMALNGEAAVITYDATVDVRQPFTQDHDAVEKAISKVDFVAPEMKLYDAMAASVQLLKARPSTRRRIMLIVGESQDYSSEAKLGQVLRDAQLANITIYAVGPSSATADLRYGTLGLSGRNKLPPIKLAKHLPPISTQAPPDDPMGRPHFDLLTPAIWLIMRGTNEIKNHQLEVAAAATGGVHYRALRDETIRTALDKVGGELHAQYVLSYMPRAERPPGFYEIKVTVSRPDVTVRTRPGYYLDPSDRPQPAP